MVEVKRFDIFLVALDPTIGGEIMKTRPCVVISPDDINAYSRTIIVAPMTTKGKLAATRIPIVFLKKSGLIVLDQLRTVDKKRLVKKLGKVSATQAAHIVHILQAMFAL